MTSSSLKKLKLSNDKYRVSSGSLNAHLSLDFLEQPVAFLAVAEDLCEARAVRPVLVSGFDGWMKSDFSKRSCHFLSA